MKKIFLILLFCAGLFAQGGKVGDMNIDFHPKKPFSSGDNEVVISLQKDGKFVSAAKIKIRVVMPPMPGMPKMDFRAEAKEQGDGYVAKLNFPHGGTWQLRFSIEVDGKVYNYKSSIDF
ncbi:FixH family protein [Helicobacter mustelae]|uniref:Putative copper resistance determinant, crdA n=1 Tax=Helicobacter mustelae (strain ATCC 43772 / CCUG 25715 / CIP 103759 / LMG 18044 / NCTC 12198 / R85-136P) TaxID=679897 RepID=D3UJF6_HELM1|nr:FixH family protein [Helicobacter mustelae]CBG40632.1 Putative copper resistance determinant, crdA [Helicobacter mustelae 12198]SQH72130.1 copper resistance determinant protein CrdA [Helicobacter mustelae]